MDNEDQVMSLILVLLLTNSLIDQLTTRLRDYRTIPFFTSSRHSHATFT